MLNILQECGSPLLPGGDWSGLNPTVLWSDEKVTGATTYVLHSGNWGKCHRHKNEKGPQLYWSTCELKCVVTDEPPPPGKL